LNKAIIEIECSNTDEAITIIDKISWIDSSAYFGKYIHATIHNNGETDTEIIEKIKKILEDKNIEVKRISRIMPSLEDVFVNLLEPGGKNA
jgi:hypothetical protein